MILRFMSPLLLILLISSIAHIITAYEYCKPEVHKKLCPKSEHTICNPANAFGKLNHKLRYEAKKFLAHVPITKKVKEYILHLHNYFRNTVASGTEISTKSNNKYPIALRMRRLIWDDELMYVAHFHATQVKMGHDWCRNTVKYPASGQNLGFAASNYMRPVLKMINTSLTEMYLEKDLIGDTTSMIGKMNQEAADVGAGHFIQLSLGKASRVGCAVSLGYDCGPAHLYCYYLVCNYDYIPSMNLVIYRSHPTTPATDCGLYEVGRDKDYPNLCANNGKFYDPIAQDKKEKREKMPP